jgi:hypothetical protein
MHILLPINIDSLTHNFNYSVYSDRCNKMALVGMDFRAPLREVKRVQFGVLSPDEIVSLTISVLYSLF